MAPPMSWMPGATPWSGSVHDKRQSMGGERRVSREPGTRWPGERKHVEHIHIVRTLRQIKENWYDKRNSHRRTLSYVATRRCHSVTFLSQVLSTIRSRCKWIIGANGCRSFHVSFHFPRKPPETPGKRQLLGTGPESDASSSLSNARRDALQTWLMAPWTRGSVAACHMSTWVNMCQHVATWQHVTRHHTTVSEAPIHCFALCFT